MMTLEEAIKHCKDVALSCTNKECALEHFQLLKWLQEYSNMLEKQGGQKGYTFKPLPRLLDMIEPTSGAKVYCQKLIDTLVKEGYSTDAKIVGECLKKMNGENVPMAIMDEKQGEQKSFDYENANIQQKDFAPKVEPKFKVKYAGREYNVLEVKDIAGVTFYGIEDEPNHIDYVQAENCERVCGYSIKENGCSFPTKPIMFSEKNPAWSEEDEERYLSCLHKLSTGNIEQPETVNTVWLKSIKDRYTWKPSDEQMAALSDINVTGCISYAGQGQKLISLYNDLKKLKG